jgi:hypothetical protein
VTRQTENGKGKISMSVPKNKGSAPIFEALDFPPESFVLSKDGREWKKIAQSRKLLFVTIAKHGETAWPGVKGLMKKTGFSRRTIFNLLDDLKELGCLPDAVDDKGRARHGLRGTRVRRIDLGALLPPGYATGWLSFKGAGLLVRCVRGREVEVQKSEVEVQNSNVKVQKSNVKVQNSTSQGAVQAAPERTWQKESDRKSNQVLAGRLVSRLSFLYSERFGKPLVSTSKQQDLLSALLAEEVDRLVENGEELDAALVYTEEGIELVFAHWVLTRDPTPEDLAYPLSKFLEEFEATDEALQRANRAEQRRDGTRPTY